MSKFVWTPDIETPVNGFRYEEFIQLLETQKSLVPEKYLSTLKVYIGCDYDESPVINMCYEESEE